MITLKLALLFMPEDVKYIKGREKIMMLYASIVLQIYFNFSIMLLQLKVFYFKNSFDMLKICIFKTNISWSPVI